jgi:hypothetical protein
MHSFTWAAMQLETDVQQTNALLAINRSEKSALSSALANAEEVLQHAQLEKENLLSLLKLEESVSSLVRRC